MDTLTIRLLHLLGAMLLFGTGLGTATQFWLAHRSGEAKAIAVVAKNVVLADWLYTLPAVIAQPLTGFLLVERYGHDPASPWLLGALGLYALAGACWIPVVVLQIRIARLAAVGDFGATYRRLVRCWFVLGWPAFLAVLAILHLMVHRPVG